MALYRLEAKPIQRSKGQSVVAAAAYRAAVKLYDARLDKLEDYQRKGGVFHSEIIVPDGALISSPWVENREKLWNTAELAEKRIDAQPGREILLAIPCELTTDAQRIALVSGFAREVFAGCGMVADVSLHRADSHGDERNDHAHILVTMRELDGEGFSKTKNREWNKTETLENWRERWEVHANRALEDAGSDARVDHRTLKAQGKNRIPTEHLGSASSKMERNGVQTVKGDRNREIKQHNQTLDTLVGELAGIDAQIAADLEKEFLGIEPDEKSPRFYFPTATRQEPPPSLLSVAPDPAANDRATEDRRKTWEEWELPPSYAKATEDKPEIPRERAKGLSYSEWLAMQPEAETENPPFPADQAEEEEEPPPSAPPAAQESAETWEEMQRKAQSPFAEALGNEFKRDIEEYGEIKEYGLGKHWYDRTMVMFENMYSKAWDVIKDAQSFVEKYVTGRTRNREREEPDMGDMGR